MRLYIFDMQSRYLSEEDNRAGGNTTIDKINFCWQSISLPPRSYLKFAGYGIHLISCGNIKESNTIKLLDGSCETGRFMTLTFAGTV